MKTLLGPEINARRRSGSLASSLCVHAAVLVWVASSAGLGPDHARRPIYETEIRPFEGHIIWYHLQSRIPNVRPTEAESTHKPPRATKKLDQNLIAGVKDSPDPPRKIWVPDPPKAEPPPPAAEPLPNLIAVAASPKLPLRTFQPPPPPPVAPNPVTKPLDAPEAVIRQAAVTSENLPIAVNLPRAVRAFVPPPTPKRDAPAPTTPETPPEATPAATATPTMAIVGLDPAKTLDIPKPPAPHEAGFSAGPKPEPDGERNSADRAALSVPSIFASGGQKDLRSLPAASLAPTLQSNLAAAMRAGVPHAAPPPSPRAPRVSSSPDPRMTGRLIYMMAIQMPNVTSYSGSWMVWFAEHQPIPGAPPLEMRPPEPVRKVDPRYVPAAANERVEGIVRLAAVIRSDGAIERVELLKHLDERLDQSAEEALSKWRFQPAARDGAPVDVDAVFEIPFHLAPRASR
jgi:TonB family protein